MSSAVYRTSTPSLTVPPTQNTAPVLEFNCMYTHDVRRKQKRWQDGFLRFHTFNNRIMVYDIPRNFIGDCHWKTGVELQDGDEVTLEACGVLVQVAEKTGSTETDLTELRRSRKKCSSEGGSSSPVRCVHPSAALVSNGKTTEAIPQLKHRSLNALLGTPKGPIGKAAFPTKSPFEERRDGAENLTGLASRPNKRMRLDEPQLWNVTRTTTVATPSKTMRPPSRSVSVSSAKSKKKTPLETGQQRLGTREVIDLSIDSDEPVSALAGFSSETFAPSSPPREARPSFAKAGAVRSSSPAFQRQKTPEIAPQRKSIERDDAASIARPREPGVGARAASFGPQVNDKPGRIQGRAERQQDAREKDRIQTTSNREELLRPLQSSRPLTSEPSKTLRMTANAPKKKTLLCQDQVSKKPSRVFSANTDRAIDTLLDVTAEAVDEPLPKAKTQRQELDERLAKIGRKTGALQTNGLESMGDGDDNQAADPLHTSASKAVHKAVHIDRAVPPAEPPRLLEGSKAHVGVAPVPPRRIPGAPVRYTPSPVKKPPLSVQQKKVLDQTDAPKRAPAIIPKQKGKSKVQPSLNLNTTSNGTSTVILSRPFRAPKSPPMKVAPPEKAANPWSREAFDLLTWRPPGWDEENWCLKATDAGTDCAA